MPEIHFLGFLGPTLQSRARAIGGLDIILLEKADLDLAWNVLERSGLHFEFIGSKLWKPRLRQSYLYIKAKEPSPALSSSSYNLHHVEHSKDANRCSRTVSWSCS